jgi:two-component system response regulator NreC
MTIRVLIADDHGVLRAGLRVLLNSEPGMEVVGEASDTEQVLLLTKELHPDIVLMDLSMPNGGGIYATQQLQKEMPEICVLILTVHEDDSLLREAVESGASGYILKRAVESELINAIQAVARGELYIHPAMTRALLNESTTTSPIHQTQVETLTHREYEVLRLISQGNSNRQIASLLTISVRTVESHRANLMEKLNLTCRSELVRYAAQHGLLEDWAYDFPVERKNDS